MCVSLFNNNRRFRGLCEHDLDGLIWPIRPFHDGKQWIGVEKRTDECEQSGEWQKNDDNNDSEWDNDNNDQDDDGFRAKELVKNRG